MLTPFIIIFWPSFSDKETFAPIYHTVAFYTQNRGRYLNSAVKSLGSIELINLHYFVLLSNKIESEVIGYANRRSLKSNYSTAVFIQTANRENNIV